MAASKKGPHISRSGDVIVLSRAARPLPAQLSPAERELARGLRAGLSNAELAAARGTSIKTVANQLHALYRKLGVCSREELIVQLTQGGADASPG